MTQTQRQRAAIYIRVSSAGQEDNTSLGTQEQDCRAYATRQGWMVSEVYQDVHRATELFERPQIMRLLEDARKGLFDSLLVWKLNRFSREPWQQGYMLHELEKAGVSVHSATEAVNSGGIEGEMLRQMLAMAAKLEETFRNQRTARGKRARIESGKPLVGQRAAYGYRWDNEDRKQRLVENPETAWVVRRIFEEAVHGKPLKAIARELNEGGVPTPNGAAIWLKGRISDIIRDTRYKGEQYGKRTRAERVPGQRHYRQVRLPREEWVRLEDVPALVDAATWQRANERLELNPRWASPQGPPT